jgi:hypothetical protein
MLHFRKNPLPEPAERYLGGLALDHSPNWIALKRSALSHFYRYLAQFKRRSVD